MDAGKLVKGRDDGDKRYYLQDQPVHCGDALELRLPGDHWARVRFEMSYTRRGTFEPVLYLYVALAVEQRFEGRPKGAGVGGFDRLRDRWEVYDLERDAPVRLSDHNEEGGVLWHELETDTFDSSWEAMRAARELNGLYHHPLEVVIREWEQCVLRWVVHEG